MDSNRLRYFLTVTETGSIRKAAELLRLSPAALSKAMKHFESEVGMQLLTPSGRGIAVTEEGRELATYGMPLLEELERLAVRIKDKQELNCKLIKPIRIGSFEVFTTHVLGDLVKYLPEDSEIFLRELVPGPLEKSLVANEIDYGITYIPIPTAGIEHQKIVTLEMGIFGQWDQFRDTPFQQLPFAVPIEPLIGSPNKVQGLDGWPEDRISRLVKYRVTMMESALELCRMGRAVCYLPTFVAVAQNKTVQEKYKLSQLPSPKGLEVQKQDVYIAKRKSDLELASHKKLARALREVCRR